MITKKRPSPNTDNCCMGSIQVMLKGTNEIETEARANRTTEKIPAAEMFFPKIGYIFGNTG